MDDPLGNALSVEVGKEIDQVKVLEQKRPILSDSLHGWDASAAGSDREMVIRSSPDSLPGR